MSHEIYKSLFENSNSVMLIIHPETGRIVDANNAACRFYGYAQDALKARFVHDINTLSKDEIYAEMQAAKAEKRHSFHFLHRRADGSLRDVEVFSGPITIGHEKLLYSIVHDITARKQMEKQIEAERHFSDSLINSLPGTMYLFDKLGRFKRWNKNFETVTGYAAGQIVEMNPLDFIAAEDKDRVREAIETVFRTGSASVEAGFATLTGKVIPYLFTGYRFVQGQMDYVVGVGIDISDRVASEGEKENLIYRLQETLSQVKILSGLLPICVSCKNIRDDKGYWKRIESYIKEHSEAEFSHSICPDCAQKLYPDLDF
jgi:PAS domain S-box-containing protein